MFEYTLLHMYTNDTLALGTPRIYRGGRCPPEPLAHLQIRRLLYTFGAGRSLGQAGPGGPGRPLGGPGRRDLFVKSHRDFFTCTKHCIFTYKTRHDNSQKIHRKFTENSRRIHEGIHHRFLQTNHGDFYNKFTAPSLLGGRPAQPCSFQPSGPPAPGV